MACAGEGSSGVLYVPENVYVDDGILVIKAERDTRPSPACGGNCSFTAGWVTSKGKWFRKFGRWEVSFCFFVFLHFGQHLSDISLLFYLIILFNPV
jgi:hypothetical protein